MDNGQVTNDLSSEVIEGTFDLARQGRVGPLSEMIEAGVPIDVRNARGDTLLIVATYAEQGRAVSRHLIDVHDMLRRELEELRGVLAQVRDGALA